MDDVWGQTKIGAEKKHQYQSRKWQTNKNDVFRFFFLQDPGEIHDIGFKTRVKHQSLTSNENLWIKFYKQF